jgi:hypothetical protein
MIGRFDYSRQYYNKNKYNVKCGTSNLSLNMAQLTQAVSVIYDDSFWKKW